MKQPITRKDLIDDLTLIFAPGAAFLIALMLRLDTLVLAALLLIQTVMAFWAIHYYRKVDIL